MADTTKPWSAATRIYAALRCLRGDLQVSRTVLPYRRDGETVKFELLGHKWFGNFSRYESGEVAEIFLSTAKTGDMLRNMTRDGAIAASLALQYGCPVEVLRDALGRDNAGNPETPLAAILDVATGKIVKII